MKVGYIGNFGPDHSTENHVRAALGNIGHDVVPLQENTRATWERLVAGVDDYDLLLWTRTGWDWLHDTGMTDPERIDVQSAVLETFADAGVPTVGFHLDRWWGLDREGQVLAEPFFGCDLVFTADGGHDDQWDAVGVNHRWASPAVLHAETARAGRVTPRRYPTPVVFVGSWRSYHPEWQYRVDLVRHLQTRWGRRTFAAYPNARYRSLRGQPLADLYATARVVVGDSCLAPLTDPPARYWSDRVPETLGRGGLLIHPWVEGIDDAYPPESGLVTYRLGDLGDLDDRITEQLRAGDLDDRRAAARAWVQAHHTYEVRMGQVLAEVAAWQTDEA